ncbi:MAG: sulfite oxidase [Gemmatimonadales bacterium]
MRIVHDLEGLNGGCRSARLVEHFLTPIERFFTRSHAAVPPIDPTTWQLEVNGLVERPARYRLDDLHRFPQRRLTATLVCAGLRRSEFLALGPLPGELPWGPEAVSTGEWSGVRLAEILRAAGVKDQAGYVELIGLDCVERHGVQFGFGGSIPLGKALDDVLLATGLNGGPLPPRHGFPVRAVVLGWIGARSIKWLGRIVLRAEPSSNYFQTEAYRVQRTVNPRDPRDVRAGVPLGEVPLNAAILDPAPGGEVPAGTCLIQGWAIGSGGRPLTAVELCVEGESDWRPAQLVGGGGGPTWSLWTIRLELSPGDHMLVARAMDISGAQMPARIDDTWNVKGYCNNAWHRVPIRVAAKLNWP